MSEKKSDAWYLDRIDALKAENEELKKRPLRQSLDAYVADHKNNGLIIADLEAKLSRYTSWQPSDPGTKEAVEYTEDRNCPYPISSGPCGDNAGCHACASMTIARALRAAMVRLEEAEKAAASYLSKLSDATADANENFRRAESEAKRADSNFEDLEAHREKSKAEFSKYIEAMKEYHLRAEAAESQVAALTASLASVTKENAELVERLRDNQGWLWETRFKDADLNLAAARTGLAELRKRMGEVRQDMTNDLTYRNDCSEHFSADCEVPGCEDPDDCVRCLVMQRIAALASPPSPAPADGENGWDEHDRLFPECDGDDHTKACDKATGDAYRKKHGLPPAPVESKPKEIEITPVSIRCPLCMETHIDEGEWVTRPHKTHQCQNCKHEWRPFAFYTVGIGPAADTAKPSPEKP